jgi:hypothetical protein
LSFCEALSFENDDKPAAIALFDRGSTFTL